MDPTWFGPIPCKEGTAWGVLSMSREEWPRLAAEANSPGMEFWGGGGSGSNLTTSNPHFFCCFFCLSGQDMGRSKARFTVYTIYHFKVLQRRDTLIFVMISLWSSAAASLCDMSSGSSRALWDGAASKALPSASRSLVQREQGRRSCQCCCVGSKCQFREWTELSSDLFCREGVRRDGPLSHETM